MCVKSVKRSFTLKARKHHKIKTVAESKLNSIKDLISKALQDGQISEMEFKTVLNELQNYDKLKENIQTKQTSLSETDKKKLIQEGKAQAMSEMKKKIENA